MYPSILSNRKCNWIFMHIFHWPQFSHMIKPSCKIRRGMWHFLWMHYFQLNIRVLWQRKKERMDAVWQVTVSISWYMVEVKSCYIYGLYHIDFQTWFLFVITWNVLKSENSLPSHSPPFYILKCNLYLLPLWSSFRG